MSNISGWDNASLNSYFLEFGSNSSNRIFALDSETDYLPLLCERDFLKAYNSCPPLKAVISKRAKGFNTGKIVAVNKKTGQPATGMYAKSILSTLERPNILQSKDQFFSQQNHYVDIFGYCPYLIIRPAGMPEEITSIWNIPPWLFDLEYTGKWLNQFEVSGIYKNYTMLWAGQKVELNYNDLHFVLDDGIGTENDCNLTIPDSRLISLDYPVTNTMAAYKARNTLITKRGAIGILTNEKDAAGALPFAKGVKESLQRDFRGYGIVGQPYQVIITDASLKWQQMGFATKDLLLFEEVEDDINRICDGYGYPPELISRNKDITFENKKEARKDVYVNTFIPESNSRMNQFSNGLLLPTAEFTITRDFSKVDVLQADAKTKAEALKVMNEALQIAYDKGLITKNDWLEKIGEQRLPNPDFDKYKDENVTPKDTGIKA